MRPLRASVADETAGTCVRLAHLWRLPAKGDGRRRGEVRASRALVATSCQRLAHLCALSSRESSRCRETRGSARLGTRKVARSRGKCVRKARKTGEVRAHFGRFRVIRARMRTEPGAGARIGGANPGQVRAPRAHGAVSCQGDGRNQAQVRDRPVAACSETGLVLDGTAEKRGMCATSPLLLAPQRLDRVLACR
jgi:hypothetical protein